MRFEKAVWHNMGPHTDWTLDLTGLPPEQKVVALTGHNGKGKSFSLESAVAGACYRSMPTQGTLARRAMAVDSSLESTIVYGGQRYRIKHLVNGGTGKGESVVTVQDGDKWVPAYQGGTGFKLFDGWAARALPDADVLFASIFAAQQSEGFVKMTSGDRIGVVLRVLGVAKYERMAAEARKRRDAAATTVEELTRRVADIRGGSKPVALAETELESANAAAEALRQAVATVETALESARGKAAEAGVVAAQREAAERELAALQAQLDRAQAQRAPIAEMVKNNRGVLEQADLIRNAAAVVTKLEAELVADAAALVAAKAEAETVRAPWRDAAARIEAATTRANRAKARLADAPAVQAAKEALPGLRDAVTEAEAEVERLSAKLDELTSAHVAGVDERLTLFRASVDKGIEFISEQEVSRGLEALLAGRNADDEAADLAKQTPSLVKETRERLDAARARVVVADKQAAAADRMAARAAEVDSAEQELREADVEVKSLFVGSSQAKAEAEAKEEVVVNLTNGIAAKQQMLTVSKPLAARLAPLDNAQKRLAELGPQLEAADAEVARLERTIAELPALPVVPTCPPLAPLQQALADAQGYLRNGEQAITRAEQTLEQARAVDTKVADFEAQRVAKLAEVERWTRLALDFGRDGIQSAEVDSAGPELTELVNDLLHTCHGPRFTVSVETQRLSADGKKTVEECTIRVIDTVEGTDKEIREHSGGERVILGEAVSLALTMLACRRAGWERPTLIRDESAAALDPVNARAWLAMMRRAVELTGADRLLFVCHNREVVELADHAIEVGATSAAVQEAA